MKTFILVLATLISTGCNSMEYKKTADYVDLSQFFGKWYVIAGRFTFLEKGAHNAIEEYTWNEEKKRIDINYYHSKDSFDGPIKKYPQKGWIENKKTNAHWKVSFFWPLKFDYLILDVAEDYSWTAVGTSNGKYLWIMSKDWTFSKDKVQGILNGLKEKGYPVDSIKYTPQKW